MKSIYSSIRVAVAAIAAVAAMAVPALSHAGSVPVIGTALVAPADARLLATNGSAPCSTDSAANQTTTAASIAHGPSANAFNSCGGPVNFAGPSNSTAPVPGNTDGGLAVVGEKVIAIAYLVDKLAFLLRMVAFLIGKVATLVGKVTALIGKVAQLLRTGMAFLRSLRASTRPIKKRKSIVSTGGAQVATI